MVKKEPEINTLPIDEVAVQERSVTIRVLTVGTKQITQSLYKQLVSESVLDDKAHLKGNVWGWVNFHSEHCTRASHFHVIWDDGETLKKCTLAQLPDSSSNYTELKNDWHNLGKAYICALFLEGVLQSSDGSERKFQINDRSITVPITNSIRALVSWRSSRGLNDNEYQAEQISQCQKKLEAEMREYLNKVFTHVSLSSDIKGQMEEVEKDLTAYENAWANSFDEIKASKQLFIAVSGVWK